MELDKLNSWLSLLANVGVVAGIVFLAVEIQQNTAIARSNAYQAPSEAISEVRNLLASDQILGEIYNRYLNDSIEELDTQEIVRLRYVINNLFAAYENAYFSMTRGILPENEWERFEIGACGHFRRITNTGMPLMLVVTDEFASYMRERC